MNFYYFVDDMNKFKGCKVLVCGGGDFVVDWFFMLELIVEKVMLMYCWDKFCVYEYSVENLYNLLVDIKILYVLVEFVGDDCII